MAILDLGPEYEDKDLNVQFCVHDWKIIIEGLKTLAEKSTDENTINDANTIRESIESELEVDERSEIGWDGAIETLKKEFEAKGKDTSNLVKLDCFLSDVSSDAETACEQWSISEVREALSAVRIECGEEYSELYSIIEEAEIHSEDLLS